MPAEERSGWDALGSDVKTTIALARKPTAGTLRKRRLGRR
jgi:hypothetical protein